MVRKTLKGEALNISVETGIWPVSTEVVGQDVIIRRGFKEIIIPLAWLPVLVERLQYLVLLKGKIQ